MRYVVYTHYDDDVNIEAFCETAADAQELILSCVEEEAYDLFLDDYLYEPEQYDAVGIDHLCSDPMKSYLEDLIPEVEDFNKFHKPISLYGYVLIKHGEWYGYHSVKEYT